MIQFSLIKKDGGVLTKKFDIVDGELVKNSKQCFLQQGKIETIELEFKDLPKFLDGLESNQAILHGVCVQAPTKVVAQRLLKQNPDAISRTKDNFFWPDQGIIMFDYDPPDGTKPLSKVKLLETMRNLHPALANAAMVWRPSASSNIISTDGTVLRGLRNQRIYIEYRNPDSMDEFMQNLERAAWDKGLGHIFITAAGTALPRCIFDMAVFSPERLDFAAGAACGDGLQPQKIYSTFESGPPVDFDDVGSLYDIERYHMQIEMAKQDVKVDITEARNIYKEIQAERLMEQQPLSKIKARKIIASRLKNKILPEDIVFANDMTTIKISDIIADSATYHGMVIRDPLEPDYGPSKAKIFADEESITINSFAHGGRVFHIKLDAEYYIKLLENFGSDIELLENWMDRIGDFTGTNADKEQIAKAVSKRTGVAKTTLLKDLKDKEKVIKQEKKELIEDLSHHQIAGRILAQFPKHTIATEGQIFSYNGANCWQAMGLNQVELEVAGRFDCLPKCSRRSDYVQISKHMYNVIQEDGFFSVKDPVIATQDCAWLLQSDGTVIQKDHDPKYRVRFLLPFESVPMDTPKPLMQGYLDWAFDGHPNQILLLQEIFGASVFSVLTRHWHKAVLFRGEGSNGKSTAIDILSGLIPPQYITQISPFQFSEPVYVAQLSHKMLNVVVELEKGQKLPAAAFKNVVDSSTLTGRPLYHAPFTFPSTAAHIFSSNYPIRTTDGSTGMKRRWLMLKFTNRVADEDKIPEFGSYIVKEEGAQIFNWALEGVQRLYKNKKFTETSFTKSLTHEMFMDTDPVNGFLADEDVILTNQQQPSLRVLRTGLYNAYREWGKEVGHRREEMLTKIRFNQRVADLGYELTKYNGKLTWKGIEMIVK